MIYQKSICFLIHCRQMNYRFQNSESILIKGKRGRDRKRKVRKRRKNEFKKENLYYSLSMNYIASYPVFLHNLRLREKMKQTLLIQPCYFSYKFLLNYKHTT